MKKQLTTGSIMLFFVVSMLGLAFLPDQSDFSILITLFGLSFLCYVFFIRSKRIESKHFYVLLGVGFLVRAVLIFCFPNLSNDIYRFFWDGILSQNAINPYTILPSELICETFKPIILDQALFDLLNSQNYYTIYPPVGQAFFYLSSFFSDIYTFSVAMKILFLAFEGLAIYYILRLCKLLDVNRNNVFIYFLNPLVIIEGIGNLHFEVVMVSFLMMSIFYLYVNGIKRFSLSFVLAIGAKLTPLLLGPLFLYHIKGFKNKLSFLLLGFVFMLIMFSPLLLGLNFVNLSESIDLYFRKFEFNASIYYVLRLIGYQYKGYNMIASIGPLLGIMSVLSIVLLSMKKETTKDHLFFVAICSYSVYLFLATTVHPWYLIPILACTVIRPYTYIIAWSGLVFLSYYTYSNLQFEENYLLLFIQYLVVYILFYIEVIRKKVLWKFKPV
jgi:hypothetical protein